MSEKKSRKHTGEWRFHDDDCWCLMGGNIKYCNRDNYVWSCCGACKEDSECTGNKMHPTYWNHPKFYDTVESYNEYHQPIYKSDEEIRKISPESFE